MVAAVERGSPGRAFFLKINVLGLRCCHSKTLVLPQGRHPSGRSGTRLGLSGLHQAYEGMHTNLGGQPSTCANQKSMHRADINNKVGLLVLRTLQFPIEINTKILG